MEYLLIIKTVLLMQTGDYSAQYIRFQVPSLYQCQVQGDAFAKKVLTMIPSNESVFYTCVKSPTKG